MNFRNFINNPIKVAMFFLALFLLGFLSYRKLPLNLFPDIQTPRITIMINTRGLSPEETETRLTADIERQLASIRGVSRITSYSREGSIVIHVDFHWGQDMEFAYLDVKKNAGVLETGEHVDKVEVYRFDPNAAPLMTLSFIPMGSGAMRYKGEDSGDKEDLVDRVQITSLVENSLKPRFETVEGVAYVKTNGASFNEVTVLLNEDIVTQYDLTVDKIMSAIKQNQISAAGGTIIEGNERMELKFASRFRNVNDIQKCVILMTEGYPLHLEDLGAVFVSAQTDEVKVFQDGVETVSLDLFREPDANAIQTARRVRRMVKELNQRGDFGLKVAVDRSLEVEAAITEVVRTALIGMVLAMIILFIFLRNIWATIIAGLAIPLSIMATFTLMHLQSLSLNIMTLGGLALGAGMLVDNGIVVIENIFRHRQKGVGSGEAAELGVREVGLAITAATLTTIVVFVPLVYVHGIAGILFKDQALTVVYSLLISLVVALVLIPMLTARVVSSRLAVPGRINHAYGRFLRLSMKLRWLLFALFLAIMGITAKKASEIPTRFFPESVAGRFSLLMEMPLGTPLERTEAAAIAMQEPLLKLRYRDPDLAPLLHSFEAWKISGNSRRFLAEIMKRTVALEEKNPTHYVINKIKALLFPEKGEKEIKRLLEMEELEQQREEIAKALSTFLEPFVVIESVITTVGVESGSVSAAGEKIFGPHTARMEVVINPDVLREIEGKDLIRLLRQRASIIPGFKCNFESRNEYLQELLGKERGDVSIEVHAETLKDLRKSSAMVEKSLEGVPGLINVRSNLVLGDEAYLLKPDRDALVRGEFQITDLTSQITAYLQGDRSDQVKLEQGEMGIMLRSPRAEREGLGGLMNLTIVSQKGQREKLENLVVLERQKGIREIMRINQEKTLLVMADMQAASYSELMAKIPPLLDKLKWLPGTYWNPSGEEVKRRESFEKLLFALALAIILVYMVIASILESLIHPLTITISVPFAATGVVAAFLLTGISLNLMGYIGVVMLTGIVVNNAIVLLDRIRQIRREQEEISLIEAVTEAGKQRLRPIMMTSLTTILALVPLAMGFGSGAELRRPMAIAVIGGLASSTLLTLWILPGLYLCVEDVRAILRRAVGFVFRFSGEQRKERSS